MHANSCANGYWTDITRTYTLGEPDDRKQQLYSAIFEARDGALNAIRPGVCARDVDAAARDSLARSGYAQEFKHSTGHGVGFSAISANALPRLHPASDDVLEVGMVFNVEPAVYFEGYGGIRHCDMVAVGPDGAEVLTDFQSELPKLLLQ
jgi:Xaa-Pro aminopeptidase